MVSELRTALRAANPSARPHTAADFAAAAATAGPVDVIFVDRPEQLESVAELRPLLRRARAASVPVKPIGWLTAALLGGRLPGPLEAVSHTMKQTLEYPSRPAGAREACEAGAAAAASPSESFGARRRSRRLSSASVGPAGLALGSGSGRGPARCPAGGREAALSQDAPSAAAAAADAAKGGSTRRAAGDRTPGGPRAKAGPPEVPGAPAKEPEQWLGEPLAGPPAVPGLVATQHRRYFSGFVRVPPCPFFLSMCPMWLRPVNKGRF